MTLEAIIFVHVFGQRRKELRVTNWLISGISELNRTVSKKGQLSPYHVHHLPWQKCVSDDIPDLSLHSGSPCLSGIHKTPIFMFRLNPISCCSNKCLPLFRNLSWNAG